MSVSQSPQKPHIPEWEAEQIIEELRENYDSPQQMYDELDMDATQIVNWAYELEPDQEDEARREELLEAEEEFADDYESKTFSPDKEDHDFDGNWRDMTYDKVFDPDNRNAWYQTIDIEDED